MVSAGEALLSEGKLLEAAEMAFKARKAAPNLPGASNLLGVIYDRLHRPDKAREAFQEAIHVAPALPEPRLNLARLDVGQNAPREALVELGEAARLAPRNPEVWMLIGQAQRLQGNHITAGEAFQRAIALAPEDPEPHVYEGIRNMDLGKTLQAVPQFEAAYRLGDHSAPTVSFLALALLTGAPTEADARRADQLLTEIGRPAILPSLFAQGLLARRAHDYPGAIRCFQQILGQDPLHERAQFQLAETYRLARDARNAASAMDRYHHMVLQRQQLTTYAARIKGEGARPALLRDYGKALVAAGKLQEAEVTFRDWTRAAPSDPDARAWLERVRRMRAAPGTHEPAPAAARSQDRP